MQRGHSHRHAQSEKAVSRIKQRLGDDSTSQESLVIDSDAPAQRPGTALRENQPHSLWCIVTAGLGDKCTGH